MSTRNVMVLVGLLILLSLLVGCGKQSTTGAATVDWNGEVKEFTVRAFKFGYEPGTLEVNLGDKVKLSAYTSDVPHGLAIYQFGVNMQLRSKNPVTTEFIADKAGTFTYYCSIPCGSGHGAMQGTFIVNG